MSIAITYEFDELPLLTEGKREGLLVWGKADITASDAEDWAVYDIWLDGIHIEKEVMPWLWHKVASALYEHSADSIADKINGEAAGVSSRLRAYTRSAA